MDFPPSTLQLDFQNRRALVTGAGKGIGRALTVMLRRFNAQVVAVSRTQSDLESLRDETGCEIIKADIGDAAEARRVGEEAGDIDLLVNNAAISILEPFLETKLESWDAQININLRAIFIISQIVSKNMIARHVAGSIVNVSSMSSFQALHDHAVYAMTKAGLDQLSNVMAVELGKHGIRVNAINPTVVMTEMGKKAWADPAKGGPMLARIPLGRFPECDDVASVICFVLSDAAAMLNGLALRVDGGFWTT